MNGFMRHDFQIDRIVLACFVPRGKGNFVHRNRPTHGLAFHTEGIKTYIFDGGKELTVHPGEIIYLPRHASYKVSAAVHGDCYAINFESRADIDFPPFVAKVKNEPGILDRFKKAKRAWEEKGIGYEMKCKAELYAILYTLQQEYAASYLSRSKMEIIRPAVEHIRRSYAAGPISVAALSKMCGITPEYFRKIFKSFFGVSPIAYVNGLKIGRARELLASELYSVTEAAQMCGYSDSSHFSREFKKATGVAPKNYKPL